MKFIELTDRFGQSITVNFDKVETFYEVEDGKEKFTKLNFANSTYYFYVKETYEQVKEALGV